MRDVLLCVLRMPKACLYLEKSGLTHRHAKLHRPENTPMPLLTSGDTAVMTGRVYCVHTNHAL